MNTVDINTLVTNFIKEHGYDPISLATDIKKRKNMVSAFQREYGYQLGRSYARRELLNIVRTVAFKLGSNDITDLSSDDYADIIMPQHATTLVLTCNETVDTLDEVRAIINELTTEMDELKTSLNQLEQTFNEINQSYKEFQELKKQFTIAQQRRQSKEDIACAVTTYTTDIIGSAINDVQPPCNFSARFSARFSAYRDEHQKQLIKRINDYAAAGAELERLRVTMLLKYNHDPTSSTPADVEHKYNTICGNIKTVYDGFNRLTERINEVNNRYTTLKHLSYEYKSHMHEGNKRETVTTLAAFYKEADELKQYLSNQHP